MEEVKYPVYNIDYRGIHLDFYIADDGQIVALWPDSGELVSLGYRNAEFKKAAKELIDRRLDEIKSDFSEKYHGAVLTYFDNAGHRDIKLVYRDRILKVFLVAVEQLVDTEKLIAEAERILEKVIR